MSDIDWPLAITLLFVFIVMSVVRFRYFRSLSRRRWGGAASRPAGDEPPRPPGDA